MDTKEIKQIIELIRRYDLTEFEVEKEGLKLRIHRKPSVDVGPTTTHPKGFPLEMPQSELSAIQLLRASATSNNPSEENDKSLYILKSPIVGTFYRSVSPESPPLVEVGTKLTATTVVGIIEAMKVMNEIQADVSGIVREILVPNGQPIEYGQPIMKIALS